MVRVSRSVRAAWVAGLVSLVLLGAASSAQAALPGRSVVWSVEPTGVSGDMAGVSCVSADACIAVGEVGYKGPPGAMVWNGRRWTLDRSVPEPGRLPPPPWDFPPASLLGVSCTSSAACIAVGSYLNLPMALFWNGSRWSLLAAPTLPSGAIGGDLQGVSCLSSTACMAVGSYDEAGTTRGFADWWDGSAWSAENMPSTPRSADLWLHSVSCTSGSACTAVGSYSVGANDRPLVERWDGSSWTTEPTPIPARSVITQLSQVSCPSLTACFAVGFYGTSLAQYFSGALIERWNGSVWSAQTMPGSFDLNSISCSSTSACTAVGDNQAGMGDSALITRWDGRRWTRKTLPDAPGPDAVSCWSSVACIALGVSASNVTALQSGLANADLTGTHAGCMSGPFTVTVTGVGISSVTWTLDGKRTKGRAIRRGTRYALRIKLSPGRHRLGAKVKFEPSARTHALTFARFVLGCPATQ